MVIAACAITAEPPQAATVAYRVVVHPNNASSALDRKFIADAFLKKLTRWGDGEIIRPADLDPENAARKRFSEDVLRRSVTAVKSYWQQLVFSGRDVPPPELSTDEEVIQFVLKHTGGIGYVSGNANLDRVKALTIR